MIDQIPEDLLKIASEKMDAVIPELESAGVEGHCIVVVLPYREGENHWGFFSSILAHRELEPDEGMTFIAPRDAMQKLMEVGWKTEKEVPNLCTLPGKIGIILYQTDTARLQIVQND